jgi:hypothetical protein
MAEPVRARRLSDEEGRLLQQLVRRGKHESIRVRRALIIMASASGTPAPAIARRVAGSPAGSTCIVVPKEITRVGSSKPIHQASDLRMDQGRRVRGSAVRPALRIVAALPPRGHRPHRLLLLPKWDGLSPIR